MIKGNEKVIGIVDGVNPLSVSFGLKKGISL